VNQLLQTQPGQQIIAIGRKQHPLHVLIDPALFILLALGDAEQGQVVVAQDYDRVCGERANQPQGFQRLTAAIDQIAAEPERVLGRIELEFFEESLKCVVAALDIADGVGCHQCSVLGTARMNGGMFASNAVPSSPTMP